MLLSLGEIHGAKANGPHIVFDSCWIFNRLQRVRAGLNRANTGPSDSVVSVGLWEVMGSLESCSIRAWVTRRPYRTANVLNTFRELNSWLGKSVLLVIWATITHHTCSKALERGTVL